MWNTVDSCKRWRTAVLFLSLSGCTALSDCKYELGQKIRTGQAWHEFDGCNEQCFTVDYRDGWKQGYYEVLTGGDGRPPLVPPKKYWKPPVFFEHDPSRQNDWYVGYQDGAANAKCQPDFHYVPTFLPPQTHQHAHLPPEVPDYLPLEHIQSDSTDSDFVYPNSEMGQPDGSAVEDKPRSAEKPPSELPDGENGTTKPPAEDYEKDPEPSTTRAEFDEESAVARLVAHNSSESASLLEQLVLKANQPESDESAGEVSP